MITLAETEMKKFFTAMAKEIKGEVEHGPSKDIADKHQDDRDKSEQIERKVKQDCVDISHETKPR